MARAIADEVLELLADGETWTGAQLAARLGVGLRTVRRAIARVRAEGVLVDADTGPGGGLRLAHRAGLPRLRLEHDEAVGLLLALAVVESLGLPLLGRGLRPVRAKLARTFRADDRGAVGRLRKRVLIGAPASTRVRETWTRPDAGAAHALQSAFVARRSVRFRYRDDRQRRSLRHVEPQYLLLNHPVWYLLGYDRDRGGGRTFRIDRVDGVEVGAESFALRPALSLSDEVEAWFRPL